MDQVFLEVDGCVINTVAAVSEMLPMAVLLGIDIPEMSFLLLCRAPNAEAEHSDVFVTTQAGARRVEEEKHDSTRNEFSGVRPTPAVLKQTWELGTELDDAIFQGGKAKANSDQNRREHRLKVCLDPL